MINTNKLKGIMAEQGKTGKDMARVINKTQKTFYMKMKAGVFDSNEIEAMVKYLNIRNPMEIFFADEVT